MSEQQREQKIYVPFSIIKEVTFNSGKTILNASFKGADLIEFVKAHTNSKGYINLGISRTKEVGKFGRTHCCWLDTWEPGQNRPTGAAQQPPAQRQPPTTSKPADPPPATGDDDVPF